MSNNKKVYPEGEQIQIDALNGVASEPQNADEGIKTQSHVVGELGNAGGAPSKLSPAILFSKTKKENVSKDAQGDGTVVVDMSIPANAAPSSTGQQTKIIASSKAAPSDSFWFFRDEVSPDLLTRSRKGKQDKTTSLNTQPAKNDASYGGANTTGISRLGAGAAKYFGFQSLWSKSTAPAATPKEQPAEQQKSPEKDPLEKQQTNKSEIPVNNLEDELKMFLPRANVVRFLEKFILFKTEEDANLCKEIKNFKKKNPGMSRSEAFESFGTKKNAEAMIRIIFNESLDSFMAYRIFDYFGKSLEKYRYQFFEKMIQNDLILVFDVSDVYSDKRREVCIVCPFERMVQEAHDIKLRIPLTQEQISVHIKEFQAHLQPLNPRYARISNTYKYAANCRQKRSAVFDKERMHHYVGNSDKFEETCQNLFLPLHKNILLQSIINKISITRDFIYTSQPKDGKKEETNASDLVKTWYVADLISKNLITNYFALHGGEKKVLKLRYRSLFKTIGPVTIRNYFGEEVAFYFAWVQFYTEWCSIICIPGLVGVGWSFAFGSFSSTAISDLLSVFDNSFSILFAFSLNLCSILYLKFWKRRNHMLSFLWDVDQNGNDSKLDQEVRNGWKPSNKLQYSEINGEMIPSETKESIAIRKAVSFMGLLTCIVGLVVIITANVGLSSYSTNRGTFGIPFLDQVGIVAESAIASAVAAIIIVVVGYLFDTVVLRLIHIENHRTMESHLNHYVWMQFLLQFINSYGFLLFTAVFRPILDIANPSITYFFGPLPCENQGAGDTCMKSLVLSVSIIFVIQQFALQLIGWIGLFLHNRKMKLFEKSFNFTYKEDKKLHEITSESFEQVYNSRIVQFGYLVLFSSAFPFGPILALINNFFEGKLNGNQYMYLFNRPFVVRSNGIGSWQTISTTLVFLGIIVNGISLPFISDGFYFAIHFFYNRGNLSKENYRLHQLIFVIVYEHLLIFCYVVVELCIPDVPESVRIGRLAEQFIDKERSKPNRFVVEEH